MNRNAAAVLLHRNSGPDLEVLLVHRAPQLRFFGDYLALPGGVVDAADLERGADEDGALAHCALREVFEETGICLDPGHAALPAARRQELRTAMLGEDESGAEAAWASLHGSLTGPLALRSTCRIRTPEFSPLRYDTLFFSAPLPAGQDAEIIAGELIDARWWRPADALAAWRRGACRIVPPVLVLLERLVDGDLETYTESAAEMAAGFQAGGLHRVYFTPGILMACLRTPTLPPATTTNCFLVGQDSLWIVDPGCPDPDEQQRLFALCDALRGEGRSLRGILCTHHHPDHIGAVAATSRRYELPVRAHELTLQRLAGEFERGPAVADGERIQLGEAPDGTPGWHLEAVFTPGHDRGHLCYRDSRYHSWIAGDMLSTVATIMIDPPEGHLQTYLASLERMLGYPNGCVHPAHGPAAADGHRLIRGFLKHRRQRHASLGTALAEGPARLEDLLPRVYWDVKAEMYPFASRSLLAGLEMMQEAGEAELRSDGRWALA